MDREQQVESKVDYESSPSGISVRFPTWYGHIIYTFFCWNGQWHYEQATHNFGMVGSRKVD